MSARRSSVALLLSAFLVSISAAERHVLTFVPDGMPVRLESATYFEDGNVLAWSWRNGTRDVLYPRLRVFVFDDRGAFVGGLRRCTGDPLQPGTRHDLRVAVDVTGVNARHRFVAMIEDVVSERMIWRVSGHTDRLVDMARRFVLATSRPDLVAVSQSNTAGDLTCPCDCEDAESLGRDTCGTAGLAAFSCTPVSFPAGCSLSYTCRR